MPHILIPPRKQIVFSKLLAQNYLNTWIQQKKNIRNWNQISMSIISRHITWLSIIKLLQKGDNGAVKRIDMRYQPLSDFLIGSLLLALVQTQWLEWKTALPQSVTCHGCSYSKQIQSSAFTAIPVIWNMQYLWYSHTQSKQNWVEFSEVVHH